jgi:hypothetical protein
MSVQQLREIPGFNIDRVAAAAGDDPDVLRMFAAAGATA